MSDALDGRRAEAKRAIGTTLLMIDYATAGEALRGVPGGRAANGGRAMLTKEEAAAQVRWLVKSLRFHRTAREDSDLAIAGYEAILAGDEIAVQRVVDRRLNCLERALREAGKEDRQIAEDIAEARRAVPGMMAEARALAEAVKHYGIEVKP